MDEKKLHKKALHEKETNAYKCIESASTHNEAKTFFVPNWFYDPTPLKFSLFYNMGRLKKNWKLELLRSTQA
jgi:hypothetical protein